ncbi:uncharacterized protein LOC128552008, partial [Mercenaria mercenaria]|uniref:uncharacterized protein LOC128552008 n=1 Tax=Mercenaria mercenaria TaxID=6596 RepID=UPI00234E7775
MVNQIYPRENPMLINTETKNWDLYLLAIVITTVFGSSIKENKLSKVNAIRDSRRNYAYTALYAISNDQRFNHHREDLVTSLTVLSESIGGEVETECRRLIEEYRTTDPTDVDKYVNQLKVPGLGFKSINDVHRDFYKGLKAELETSVDINLKDNCELEIMIQLVCEDKDKQKKAEDSIDKFLTAILSGQPEASPDFPEVRKTIETINSIPSVKLTCVEKSCLLLTIEYQSKQALLSLINYVDSLEFQQHLDNISIEMASQFDEVFNLQGHFTIESLLRVLPNQ